MLDANSDAYFDLLLGGAKANRAFVPVNFRLALPELVFVLEDCQAEVLVIGEPFVGQLDALLSQCRTIRHVLTLGPVAFAAPAGVVSMAYDSWVAAQSPVDIVDPASGSDVVLLVYTSGTSGHPKGALLTDANLLVLPPVLRRAFDCTPADVSLICLPLFHVGGGLWGLGSLFAGMTTVVLRTSAPADILRAIAAHRVTSVFLVPALLQLLLDELARERLDCSTLRLVVYGGSPMPAPILRAAQQAFACRFAQLYGLTETAGALTHLTPEDHLQPDSPRLHSCGRPLDVVTIRVVDVDGQEVPRTRIGEIVCRGPQVMAGYWQRPSDTEELLRDGWFHTGDAGCMDQDGYLYIVDRIKDMIITAGENVYPAEVERVLGAHPSVGEVAVVGVPDPRWGEAVHAVVVPRTGRVATTDELSTWCRGQLAGYKVPRTFDFVTALPRNASGKVLKRELRRR